MENLLIVICTFFATFIVSFLSFLVIERKNEKQYINRGYIQLNGEIYILSKVSKEFLSKVICNESICGKTEQVEHSTVQKKTSPKLNPPSNKEDINFR